MREKRVVIDGRKFVIVYKEDDTPHLVRERVLLNKGHPYLETWAERPYWHSKHAGSTRGLIKRILEKGENPDA
jgi:hypothetical protein